MSELERRLADYRRRVLQRDQQAALSLIAAFGQALDRIRPAAELLQWEIDELGKTNITRILSLDRYVMLERQIVDEMNALARQTGTSVRGAEAEMIQLGAEAALRLVEASAADPTISAGFTRVNPDAVRELVGATEPDSPVGKLLDSFGEDAAKLLRETLVTAVATGTNPRPVAAALQAATGMSATRALAISRTEILRAYRTSQLAHYAANDDILKGWKWLSAKQRRTCAACLAMDGTVFPLSQTFFPAHVNCRCSARPVLKDEYAAKRDPVESGADWLARQSAETQDAILGKQGGAAYRAGEVQLGDFVRTDKHPTWGESKRDGGIAWARKQAERRARNAVVAPEPFTSAKAAREFLAGRGIEVDHKELRKIAKQQGYTTENADQIERSFADAIRDVEHRTGQSININRVRWETMGTQEAQYDSPKPFRQPYGWEFMDDAERARIRRNYESGGVFVWLRKGSSMWRARDSIAAAERSLKSRVNLGMDYVFRHEFAHALDAQQLLTRDNAPTDRASYDDWSKNVWLRDLTDSERAIAAKVSDYATVNRAEFIAETFAGTLRGDQYPADVRELYRRLGGPEVIR